nr:reverse transcriptase domain-containing protein [Tanacetum cinerariifolium]
MFLGKYFPPPMVTKLRNEITNFRQRPDESFFEAWEHYKLSIDRCPNHNMLPVTQIDTFYNGLTLRHRDTSNAAAGGTFMKRRLEECYDLIENMTAHHNDWDTLTQQSESSSSITSSSHTKIAALKDKMAEINKNLIRVLQVNQQVKAVTLNCETCGGPHSFNDCPATVGNTQNLYAAGAYQDVSMPTSPVHDRYKSGEGCHAVPPPYTGTFMPPKSNLVFHDAPTINEIVLTILNVEPSPTKPNKDLSQSNRPSAPIIEDWVSDSEDESEGELMPRRKAPSFVQTSEHVKTPRQSVKPVEHPIPAETLSKDIPKHVVPTTVLTRSRLVPLTAARPVTTVVPQPKVQHQRPSIQGVNRAHSPIRRPINRRTSPKHSNFHPKVTTVKTTQVNAVQGVKGNWGNLQHALKDKGVIDSGCS